MSAKLCPYCFSALPDGAHCPDCPEDLIPAAHHLPAGTMLSGRYRIGKVTGEGGFGITYIGYDTRLEVRAAVKEYFPRDIAQRSSASSEVRFADSVDEKRFVHGKERFLGEARSAAQMGKQSVIVSVRDFFEENNTAYMVMEYISGETLAQLAAKSGGRIPADRLFELIEPLFGALAALHSGGLIHRDISPDNIMIENGKPRLLDLGCAREASEWDRTATVAVTKSFTPIEQYRSKGQGPWTDIYSLGAVIYFCLTGEPPISPFDRLAGDKLIPPSEKGADISPKREKALLKALDVHSGKRYRNVTDMYQALYGEGNSGSGKAPAGKHRILLWAGITAAAAAIAGAVIIMRQPDIPVIAEKEPEPVVYTAADDFHFYVTGDGAVIDRYTGTDLEIYVPPVLDEWRVAEYDALAFDLERFERQQKESIETGEDADFGGIGVYCFPTDDIHWNISKVVFSEGLKEIGDFAFTECRSLKTVIIPEGTERIGIMCFNMCDSLEDLHLPDSIKEIGDYAFNSSVISGSLELPASLAEISPMTFRRASVGSVTIPEGVAAIGEYAFDGCYFASEDASVIIPDSVTDIRKGAFRFCQSLCSVKLPKNLTVIKAGVFEGCGSLRSVELPETVEIIGERAFAYCASLRKMTFPDTLTEIQSGAFEGCIMLKSVSVPKGCRIADDAFGSEPVYVEYR